MSRNLGQTLCAYGCGSVVLEEEARPITKEEAGIYFKEFEGMLVANAHCPACLAQYLAWMDQAPMRLRRGGTQQSAIWADLDQKRYDLVSGKLVHHDLSFRSTFNDEPGPLDLPVYLTIACTIRVPHDEDSEDIAPYTWSGDMKRVYKERLDKAKADLQVFGPLGPLLHNDVRGNSEMEIMIRDERERRGIK